ncbi:MAG: hypothetical protein ACRENE_16010 [Polyangiaceae bacterium]
MNVRTAAVLVSMTALTWSASAPAETRPSVWDIARDPGEAGRWDLHVRVERLLQGSLRMRGEDELRREAARVMLEDADAAHSPDVRLRFDLGIVYEELELHRRAVDVLQPAIESAPDHPSAVRALSALAYAYAKLGDAPRELEVWRTYIPRLVSESARATEMMNMGEAEMRLGRIEDALDTFTEVLRLCGELPNSSGVSTTYVLTLWDLAVALDRSGDPRGALTTTRKALAWSGRTIDRSINGWDAIKEPGIAFFVPEWERDWYLALGSAALAGVATDSLEAARLKAEAARYRGAYVERATASGSKDPWLAVAKRRAREAAADAAAAIARLARPAPTSKPAASP